MKRLVLVGMSVAALCAQAGGADYPVKAADMTNVTITAGFWLPRFETNRVVTVKVDFEKSEETGRLANFREAAKRAQGTFKGCPFDDSDVFKIIEGAAYTLATHPDPKLEKYLDDLIADIAGAQEADGYLYTARTLGMEKVKGFPRAGMMGPERWSNTGASHEFYNMGHMIEAGVAYWRVTGKRSLLDVAIKAADMMDRTFGYGPGQIQRVPGHEEIELALCKLYRATGEVRYLKLAKTLLDFRGKGRAYNQDHLPVTKQDQACGHAVRAGYLYTAMADVAALLGDPSYRIASERLWKDVVDTKLHLNGGIGAHRRAVVPGFGSVGEAFGAPYDLPNENAYLETCAAIANALWNDRLFLFSGDGKYMDVIERIIYNGFLSGISLSGDEFFYPNPLASAGGYARSKWFGCSCCPVNVVRFIPQIAQYAYSTSGNTAYLNLYIASDVRLALSSGTVRLSQETEYPWSGKVKIKVMPGERASVRQQGNFTLNVRIPGWCVGRPVPSTLYEQTVPSSLSNFKVKVNGEPFAFTPKKGYCSIDRSWKNGDVVEVDMNMPVKRIKADARVAADRGRLAVERGPIVWCAEGIDNGGHARDIVLPSDAVFAETCVDVCGVRMPALTATGHHAVKGISKVTAGPDVTVKLIPYFAWCHREAGEMQTWFPASDEAVADKVTLASLLAEMTDPDANTYLPSPRHTARLWSSHDRGSTLPGKPGWFANADASQFIREENNGGRREHVLLDAQGPGAITRFWVTVAQTEGKGTLRFYIDGKLSVEGEVLKLLSGGALCAAPLSDSVSTESPYLNRGHNLYLPIPYAKSCKVTYESETLDNPRPDKDGKTRKESFYYNVETRTYAPGTEVESFSLDVLRREKAAVDAANRVLARRQNGADKVVDETLSFDGAISPGESVSRTVTREKGGAIRRLAMSVANGKKPQALRSTVLEISFDGERTVWAPVGEFFGCGYTYEAYSSWFTSCTGAGRMESRWAMPFEKTCTVTVRNLGSAPVSVTLTALEIGPYRWDPARSLHFGACWHEYADAPSRKGAEKLQYDFDYAELEGEGLFVGTTFALWQPSTKWWGEGDEKVFVDGEAAPSFIGTGTEDHYGYAWCRPQPFDHPFLAQPIGIGQGRPVNADNPRRNAVNVRNRALDAIPFTKSIRFHMEMWHWQDDLKLDFAPLACWYMRPGGKANHGADPAAVRRPVRVDEPPRRVDLPKTAKLFADFEDGTYGAWQKTGEAFGPGPARGILPEQNPVTGYSGSYLVNTYYKKDETKGTLTSPAFVVEMPFINFLVGGGNYKDQTCVNLVVDGKTVRTVTGKNNERLDWTHWDVSEFKGKTARIVIVDDRTGHFGHINADCFYFDVAPRK